jgi:hypothetical protein
VKRVVPYLLLSACWAPELAPATELAGSQRIGTGGIAAESVADKPPFSAWTAAAPLTLVGPGGSNVSVLDRFGMRVEVLQIRSGRIRVRCTSCGENTKDAEGWLPRNVLWMQPAAGSDPEPSARDPLTVLLALRARWAAGQDVPEGTTADALCWLADHGISVDAGAAIGSAGDGQIHFQRLGATWKMTSLQTPTSAAWSCAAAPGAAAR